MKNIFLIMLSITFFLISCEKDDIVNTTNDVALKSTPTVIIPATKGEFYSYSAKFNADKPLYYMMACKANKAQSPTAFSVEELNLTFAFGNQVSINSANNLNSQNVLREDLEEGSNLNNAEIRNANITVEAFYNCFNQMNESTLYDIIENSTEVSDSKNLHNGQVLSIKTSNGKFGLILVKKVSTNSVQIDACHILK